jgi:hypothetical protein
LFEATARQRCIGGCVHGLGNLANLALGTLANSLENVLATPK